MDGSTERAEVEAACQGRPEAFEGLIRDHLSRVRALCFARTGPSAPLDDLVQETFLRAHRGLATLQDPARFSSWLMGIAIRVCSEWSKARSRREAPLSADPPDAHATEDGARLRELVAGLPEIYRETLLLFYYERRRYREIAELLGIGEAAVNARLTKARALLREQLQEDA